MQEAALLERPSVLAVMKELQRLLDILQDPCRVDAENAECKGREAVTKEMETYVEKVRREAYEKGLQDGADEEKKISATLQDSLKREALANMNKKTDAQWKRELNDAVARAKSKAREEANTKANAEIRVAAQRASQENVENLIDVIYFALLFDHHSPWGYAERNTALHSVAGKHNVTPQDLEDISLAGRSLISHPPGIVMSHKDALVACKKRAFKLLHDPDSQAFPKQTALLSLKGSLTWSDIRKKIEPLKTSDFFVSPPFSVMSVIPAMPPTMPTMPLAGNALPIQLQPSTFEPNSQATHKSQEVSQKTSTALAEVSTGTADLSGSLPNDNSTVSDVSTGMLYQSDRNVAEKNQCFVNSMAVTTPEEAAKSGANLAQQFFPMRSEATYPISPSKNTTVATGNNAVELQKKQATGLHSHKNIAKKKSTITSPPSFTGDSDLGITAMESAEDPETLPAAAKLTSNSMPPKPLGKLRKGMDNNNCSKSSLVSRNQKPPMPSKELMQVEVTDVAKDTSTKDEQKIGAKIVMKKDNSPSKNDKDGEIKASKIDIRKQDYVEMQESLADNQKGVDRAKKNRQKHWRSGNRHINKNLSKDETTLQPRKAPTTEPDGTVQTQQSGKGHRRGQGLGKFQPKTQKPILSS